MCTDVLLVSTKRKLVDFDLVKSPEGGVAMEGVGCRIKAARKAKKLTQEELGRKIGVSFQAIAQWETGRRNPKYETLLKISNALETTIAFFAPQTELEKAFFMLNKDGQAEAIKRIKELAQFPQYIDQEGK